MTMTKRELLLRVCEQPGFVLPDSSALLQAAEELNREGWVSWSGMGEEGLEATSRALDAYPDFASQSDIAAPPPEPAAEVAAQVITQSRLHTFVHALLSDGVPLSTVAMAACTVPASLGSPDTIVGRAAREVVEVISAGL